MNVNMTEQEKANSKAKLDELYDREFKAHNKLNDSIEQNNVRWIKVYSKAIDSIEDEIDKHYHELYG